MISKLSATTALVAFALGTISFAEAQTKTGEGTDGRFLAEIPEAARASEWIGETVYASEAEGAETIGEISDLVVSKDGDIDAAVIEVGGFLGVGEKDVAVKFDSLKFVSKEGGDSYVVLEASKAELDAAPAFENEPVSTAQVETTAPEPAPSMGNTGPDRAADQPMSQGDCETEWANADADQDGELNDTEKERYLAASRVTDNPIATDVTLTKEVFLENCVAGHFTTANAPEPGAPFEGANSFTEEQARDRVLAAGFSDVSALTKDDKGIWRGTARSGDGEVTVAVDFKGNVVPGNK